MHAFADLMQDIWKKGQRRHQSVNTTPLKLHIEKFAPRFLGSDQQDAQEFLRFLLEGLNDDVSQPSIMPPPTRDAPSSIDDQTATDLWIQSTRAGTSIFSDLFTGELKSKLRCTVCGCISVALDPFWDVSLPIPVNTGQVQLQACLEMFTKAEVLNGDNKPNCSECQRHQKCTKTFSVSKFLRVLVVHLKRLTSMERYRNCKVNYPLSGLNLSTISEAQGAPYALYGVINHAGTATSGHYTAYCRHPYSTLWHEYNDARVRPVPQRRVEDNARAYMLFYKQDESWTCRR